MSVPWGDVIAVLLVFVVGPLTLVSLAYRETFRREVGE